MPAIRSGGRAAAVADARGTLKRDAQCHRTASSQLFRMPPSPRRRCGRRCRLPASRIASCWAASSGGASPPTRTSARRSSSITSGRRRTRSRNIGKLLAALEGLVSDEFIEDAQRGFERAPMSVRVSPYLLSLIDWSEPVRRSAAPAVHPARRRASCPITRKLDLDSLHERADTPVPGLTHRYADKALFLPLDTCPVYCRFCTRSYAVGIDTEEVEKVQLKVERRALAAGVRRTSRSRPELEDIVISGGDAYQLRARADHADRRDAARRSTNIRRMRFATKGPAVMPQKILTDDAWIDALTARRRARAASCTRRSCCTRTSTTRNEITGDHRRRRWTSCSSAASPCATRACCSAASTTASTTMKLLVKRLGHVNVHPYYVYVHDLVKGVEDLRTTLQTGARHREARARRDGGLQHADVRRRRARAAAASATRTRTSTTTARPASRCSPRPASSPGDDVLLLRPDRPAAARGPGPLGRPRRARGHGRGGSRRRPRIAPLIFPLDPRSGPLAPRSGERVG